MNLFSYHFNRSEHTYRSQRIKLLDVVSACNQLNVNAQYKLDVVHKLFLQHVERSFSLWGDLTDRILVNF